MSVYHSLLASVLHVLYNIKRLDEAKDTLRTPASAPCACQTDP